MSHRKSLAIFIIPMYYAFFTRYKGATGVSAWLIKYLIPIFFVSCGLEGFNICRFVFGVLYLYSLYELGYIQNDCETIKKENAPTLRLSKEQLDMYEQNKKTIYLMRLILLVIWGTVLYYLYNVSVWLLLYGLITLPVFMCYNYIRSGFCLIIHLLLMMLRYTVPVFLAINTFGLSAAIFLLFTYPITLFIERSVKGKFGYTNHLFAKWFMSDYSCRYAFRTKYYTLMSAVTAVAVSVTLIPYTYFIPMFMLLLTSIINVRSQRLRYNK